jgi:WhiB family transcriptional regulator, redox-sensing transcriptional regulator
MYDQHVTREQRGESPAHLSAVDDAPQTDSEAGAARGDCAISIDNDVSGDVRSEIVPVDAASAYVVHTEADIDSDDDSDDGIAEQLSMREPVKPALSLIAGFDQMFEEIEDQWQERALCAQTDPEAFFPEKGGSTREAKRICLGCEVKDECLEYALANDERFGIWGGLSERERRRLKRGIG